MIIYFTGTGNSRYLSEKLSAIIDDEMVSLNEYIKEKKIGKFYSTKPYVLVCPTYSWRVPRLVEDFIRKSKFSGNREMYFILTCGDQVGKAGIYAEKLAKEIEKDYRGLAKVDMPENYVALFDVPSREESREIIKKAEKRIEKIGEEILANKKLTTQNRFGDGFLSHVVNPLFYQFIVKAKKFHIEGNCIGCGLCQRICPLNNIVLKQKMPVWGSHCTHCMACIGNCPTGCIEYGKATQKRRKYTFDDNDK